MTRQALVNLIDTLPDETVSKIEMFVNFLVYASKPRSNEVSVVDVDEILKDYQSPFPEVNDRTVLEEPIPGIAKGKFWMAEDFDAPLEEMMEYMY